MGRATVRATFDGVVAKRMHNPGDLVEATSGDPVLRIIDPRRLEADLLRYVERAAHASSTRS